ncbi:MAG: CheR family methyltransferase [Burkholderiales bacterium]
MSKEFKYEQSDYERVASHLYHIAGIHLGDSRKEMVYSRLTRELRRLGLDSVRAYLDYLDHAGQHEWTRFVNILTTNLTSFFRERHHFKILADQVLPFAQQPVRIWSCGCASGEEPYSIAITCQETIGSTQMPVSILATDINTSMLQSAERGIYEQEKVEGLDPAQLRNYFWCGEGRNSGFVKVKSELKQHIQFRMLNLMQPDWPIEGQFDAIFCRNVMIYFDKTTQYQILKRFVPLLRQPHGLLFAGHSEAFFNAKDLFTPMGATTYRVADEVRAHAAH